MKLSDVTPVDVAMYLRLIYSDSVEDELVPIMSVAQSYISSYTSIPVSDLDKHDDFYIVFMILCSHMYDNRCLVVDNKSLNTVVNSILDMHSNNLVG